MVRYAVIDPSAGGTVVGIRKFEKPLDPGSYNDETSAVANHKPFLVPVIDAAPAPVGQIAVSFTYAKVGPNVVETATYAPIPTPMSELDGILSSKFMSAIVDEIAKAAGKPRVAIVANLRAAMG